MGLWMRLGYQKIIDLTSVLKCTLSLFVLLYLVQFSKLGHNHDYCFIYCVCAACIQLVPHVTWLNCTCVLRLLLCLRPLRADNVVVCQVI